MLERLVKVGENHSEKTIQKNWFPFTLVLNSEPKHIKRGEYAKFKFNKRVKREVYRKIISKNKPECEKQQYVPKYLHPVKQLRRAADGEDIDAGETVISRNETTEKIEENGISKIYQIAQQYLKTNIFFTVTFFSSNCSTIFIYNNCILSIVFFCFSLV